MNDLCVGQLLIWPIPPSDMGLNLHPWHWCQSLHQPHALVISSESQIRVTNTSPGLVWLSSHDLGRLGSPRRCMFYSHQYDPIQHIKSVVLFINHWVFPWSIKQLDSTQFGNVEPYIQTNCLSIQFTRLKGNKFKRNYTRHGILWQVANSLCMPHKDKL